MTCRLFDGCSVHVGLTSSSASPLLSTRVPLIMAGAKEAEGGLADEGQEDDGILGWP
jgi:hypothetical protein